MGYMTMKAMPGTPASRDASTPEGFSARLERETDLSLMESANWRAGRPLDDTERWRYNTSRVGGIKERAELDAEDLRAKESEKKRRLSEQRRGRGNERGKQPRWDS
jgi:hypothetical protein